MSRSGGAQPPSRRGLVRTIAGLAAAGASFGVRGGGAQTRDAPAGASAASDDARSQIEPFWGPHQAGIATPAQRHTYAAAFDLVTPRREDVAAMLQLWTSAAARMSTGVPVRSLGQGAVEAVPDSGEALGLAASRLTLTLGFGIGLFVKDGKDRYGLTAQRPPALVDLPAFEGDELIETRTGGDLSVQACADDPQVAFHAVRRFAQLARGVARMRWAQTGFLPGADPQQSPRNLMGFKEGASNLATDDAAAMQKFIWVGDEGPEWLRGGSYVVMRRIRIALEHWDRLPLDFQEQTFGRHKYSGIPLGSDNEADSPDLNRMGSDGDPVIPESAHIRLAAAASNDGARILRRPYSYNDGVDFVTERWPPWRQGLEYDAGLFFVCYQRDPRTGFIKIFDRLAKFDMLNQFVTHTGGGLFACPGGVAPGEFIGQRLLTS